MLAMQDKPGLIQEPSVTIPDRQRTKKIQREDVNLLPTTQIIAPNIDLLPSKMTKSQATMVNEATCSTNAVDSLNSNTNTMTHSMSALSNDLNHQVSSRPQSVHTNNTHILAGTNNGPVAPTPIAAVGTPSLMASTTSSTSTTMATNTNNCCSTSTSTSTANSTSAITNNTRTKRTANDYRFGKTIGEGSFSSVYIAQDIHTKREVASK